MVRKARLRELTFFDTLTKKQGDAGNGLLVEEKKERRRPPAAVIMVPGAPAKPRGRKRRRRLHPRPRSLRPPWLRHR